MTTTAAAAAAAPCDEWVPVPDVEKDDHVQYMGAFAVQLYNEQHDADLKFIQVVDAQVLEHGGKHYWFKLVIKIHDENGSSKFFPGDLLDGLNESARWSPLNSPS